MLAPILFATLVVSTPYTDAHSRFSLDLPSGWEHGPMPADPTGVSFRCTAANKIALAAVRVVPAKGMNPAAVVRKLGETMEAEPGFRLVEEGSTELAGRPAARRRYLAYVDGNPEMVKTAEDRAVVVDDLAFLVHVEALSATFFDFEKDFGHIFSTFRLGSKPGARPEMSGGPAVGRWLMAGTSDTFLDLRPDGSFDLAGTTGTYRVQGNTLQMWMAGGMEEFAFRLAGEDLILSSSSLGEPIRYHRAGGAPGALAGTWEGGGRTLVLDEGGTVTLGKLTGAFRIDGNKVILQFGNAKKVLRYKLAGDVLVLKGWKFGTGTRMKRKQNQP